LLAFETSGVALCVDPGRREQNRCRSTAQQTIQSNPREDAYRDDRRIDVGEVPARVDEGDNEQGDNPASDACQGNLSRDGPATARAAVSISEVPSAAWTGRHSCEQNDATIA
jgi:hypothetical protein